MIPIGSGGQMPGAIPPQLPPGVTPMGSLFADRPGLMAAPGPFVGNQQNHFGDARGLGILNFLQQRNPALLARLQARFPTLGSGGMPPAFGMAKFPRASAY